MRPAFTGLILALFALGLASSADAQRRVRVAPRLGGPPLTEVRRALRAMQPDVQRCALAHEPPGTGRTRRLRMRVWLYPNGRWLLDVPELGGAGARPAPNRRAVGVVASGGPHGALRVCLQSALSARIRTFMRPFRARTRQKVEQAFSVRMPGPPPSEAQLARLLTQRRRQLIACVPGADSSGEPADLIVRASLQRDGTFEVTGVGVPETAPFSQVVACVTTELRNVHTEPVTSVAPVEVPIRFRYRSPTPPVPPPSAPSPDVEPGAPEA